MINFELAWLLSHSLHVTNNGENAESTASPSQECHTVCVYHIRSQVTGNR